MIARLPYFDIDKPRTFYNDNYATAAYRTLEQSYQLAKLSMENSVKKQDKYFNKINNVKIRTFHEGDKIMIHASGKPEGSNFNAKFLQTWTGPYTVTKVLSRTNVLVQKEGQRKSFLTHVNRIKHYKSPPPPLQITQSQSQSPHIQKGKVLRSGKVLMSSLSNADSDDDYLFVIEVANLEIEDIPNEVNTPTAALQSSEDIASLPSTSTAALATTRAAPPPPKVVANPLTQIYNSEAEDQNSSFNYESATSENDLHDEEVSNISAAAAASLPSTARVPSPIDILSSIANGIGLVSGIRPPPTTTTTTTRTNPSSLTAHKTTTSATEKHKRITRSAKDPNIKDFKISDINVPLPDARTRKKSLSKVIK